MAGVFANGLEISGKAVSAKTIAAFPDTCFTPPENPATPPGVPVPYPSFGMAGDTDKGTGTVKIAGQTVNIKNLSYLTGTKGTEAGCAAKKGIITSKNTGKEYFNSWSPDVKFDGEPVIRMSDLATNNHGSPVANTCPWVHAAKVNIGDVNCVTILNKYEIKLHQHRKNKPPDKVCDDNQNSEHYVENQILAKSPRSLRQAKPQFSGYHLDYAPCICMDSYQPGGRKTKGTNHYEKGQKAKDYLKANPNCTLGQAADACIDGVLENHRKTKNEYNSSEESKKNLKDTLGECLKKIFLLHLAEAMGKVVDDEDEESLATVTANLAAIKI